MCTFLYVCVCVRETAYAVDGELQSLLLEASFIQLC